MENLINRKYENIEVLHWGRSGWSTLREYNFLVEHGKDYNVDIIVVGWVPNDPDMGSEKRYLTWQNRVLIKLVLRKIWPNLVYFSAGYINNIRFDNLFYPLDLFEILKIIEKTN